MRWSKYFIPTLREEPKEAEIVSHRLMLRAGLIQKLAGGLYSYLPLGLRVIRKIETIVREELNKRGAIELEMPILQPKELWEKSGRWDTMGPLMMRLRNREEKDFVLAPTHEEIITDIVARNIRSYKDLPKNFYQIQTKFRDEIRPRFGIIRAKEFIMKDGYSFHATEGDADAEYKKMYEAYSEIFKRCGLTVKPVEADTGVMGGYQSHEFTVPAAAGEDIIVECPKCGYTANLELAERTSKPQAPSLPEKQASGTSKPQVLEEVDTPNLKKVEELTKFFKCDSINFIKTLIYKIDNKPIAVLVRGDIEISETKLRHALGSTNVELADDNTITETTHAPVGFAGPVGLKGIKIIADESIKGMVNAITGANKKDKHIKNVNLDRDFKVDKFLDLGTAISGDLCRKCNAELKFSHGIELGQVFKLGTKYSEKMGALFLDEKGKLHPAIMGCYGIGISRTVAALVECNNDKDGIIWPISVAPFTLLILPINYNEPKIKEVTDSIYKELKELDVDVLLDDRDETAGIKFKDGDLIGIPIKVVIGKKNLDKGLVEIKLRKDNSTSLVPYAEVISSVKAILG